jgi:hypothetical protein
MEFKKIDLISDPLNQAISSFVDRMDMTGRDREIFYDILGFVYDEGKIKGKEEILFDEEIKPSENVEN